MKHEYLRFVCCPCCKSDLDLIADQATAHKVLEGTLRCTKCTELFPVRNAIPRFVQNTRYADSFGHQWRAFSRTQLDNEHNRESEIRFTSELGWQEADLHDRLVVEFGSGAGRFIDVVSRKGARLEVGVDATDAVDADQANLGDRSNVFFIQADFFKLPLKAGTFDKVYSIGVLHHTPDPEGAFKLMIETAKVDGAVGLSLYEIVLYHRPPLNSLKGSIK